MDDLLELTGRAEATHFWFRGFRKFVAPVIDDLADGRARLRLVDCGCGTGHNLRLLQPHGRAIGFDLTASGPARAHADGWVVLRGDVTRIPLASETFDVATAFDVLQCVDADVTALREMARIVRPGGAVVVTLAAFNALRGDHAEVWNEVRRYTPATARRLVEAAGLRLERVSFVFASVFPAGRRGAARAASDPPIPVRTARRRGHRRPECAGEWIADGPGERRGRAAQTRADADRQFAACGREET